MRQGLWLAGIVMICGALPAPARELSMDERIAAQRAVERVYWQHRAWPAENPGPKPAFEATIADAAIRAKVDDTLRKSAALQERWHRSVTPADLQSELDRMARDTRAPDVLRELFEALGNDAHVIAETLVLPVVVDRKLRRAYERDNAASSFDAWWAVERARIEASSVPSSGGVRLPSVALASCTNDTWKRTHQDIPDGRSLATAVWTGSEMIVWGGQQNETDVLSSGGRYDPATDTWAVTSTGAGVPVGRTGHTAVWTGTEMIIWGGKPAANSSWLDSGSRYDPVTDAWAPIAVTASTPVPRVGHSAVWSGSEMIVWGGHSTNPITAMNTGGRYDPSTDSWTPTSTATSVPARRTGHSAVWTGSRMIVWGGGGGGIDRADGGVYDPVQDTWLPTSTGPGTPSGRYGHATVWTGAEMIVWAGFGSGYKNDGGRYNPMTDTWTAIPSTGAPSPRATPAAVWTGSEMIVWGGLPAAAFPYPNTGGRYAPATGIWTATAIDAATPAGRESPVAVWTGSEMIVWGGLDSTGNPWPTSGGRYDPSADAWTPTSVATDVPRGAWGPAEVWTGAELLVFGGRNEKQAFVPSGSRYDPATDTWTPIPPNANAPLQSGVAVWSGREMLAFGATSQGGFGGRYDPATGTWRLISSPGFTTGANPVWSGKEAIFWGGNGGSVGSRYNPTTDTWLPTSMGANVPAPRTGHLAVWAGNEMIIWGGQSPSSQYLNSGARYNPTTDTWTTMSVSGSTPSARTNASGVWTGSELVVWGGWDASGPWNTGGRYVPATNSWTATSTGLHCPSARTGAFAVWSGAEMVVWGGGGSVPPGFVTGGRYDPVTDAWTPTSTGVDVPRVRGSGHGKSLWTGRELLFWGGGLANFTTTGALYCACPNGRLTYRDADGDGFGDPAISRPSCDGSPVAGFSPDAGDCRDDASAIHPGAVESCNALDDDCDGVVDGLDPDGDGLAAACDNCAGAFNPAQSDLDHDGEGDPCDLDDGVIVLLSSSDDLIEWQTEAGAESFNVYEGDLAVLRATGVYTQSSASSTLAQRTCGVSGAVLEDVEAITAGAAKFALVTGVSAGAEGDFGTDSAGTWRVNSSPCP